MTIRDRHARLTTFLSQLELPTEKFDPMDPAKPLKRGFSPAHLDDLYPGAAHDMAAILAALGEHRGEPDDDHAMADDARQAVVELFSAIEALDQAAVASRNFVRLYEPLVKYLAMVSTADDVAFTDRFRECYAEEAAARKDRKKTPSITSAQLGTLHNALTSESVGAIEEEPAQSPQNGLKCEPPKPVLDPRRAVTNALRLRNLAAHQYLPAGSRLVPFLQESLVSLASLFGANEQRNGALQRHLTTAERAPFLIAPYLKRVVAKEPEQHLRFLHRFLKGALTVPRRLRYQLSTDEAQPATLEDAVRRFHRVWLHGDGGAGKTTFLQHLARRMAEASTERFMPILVRLVDFRPNVARGSLTALIKAAMEVPVDRPLPSLAGWTPVLLLDGFNELSMRDQDALLRELEELELLWRSARVWLSARIPAPSDEWQHASLVPWSDADALAYLESIRLGGRGLDVARFWRELGERSYGEMMRRSPLMLTLGATYILQAGASAPSGEGVIFRGIIEGFFQREADKRYREDDADLIEARRTLGRLAWLMLERGTLTLTEADLRSVLDGAQAFKTGSALQFLLSVGLLERSDEGYMFLHQAFRGYFATEYFLGGEHDAVHEDGGSTRLERLVYDLERLIQRRIFLPLGESGLTEGEVARLNEEYKELATILSFYAEFCGPAARREFVRWAVDLPISPEIGPRWTGWFAAALRSACLLSAGYPAERLLTIEDLLDVYRKAAGVGIETAGLFLDAMSGCGLEALAARVAEDIEIAPGLSLGSFSKGELGAWTIEDLVRQMRFPTAELYYLWRVDPAWTADVVGKFFPVWRAGLSADDSSRSYVFFTWIDANTWRALSGTTLRDPDEAVDSSYGDLVDAVYRVREAAAHCKLLALVLATRPDLWPQLTGVASVGNGWFQVAHLLQVLFWSKIDDDHGGVRISTLEILDFRHFFLPSSFHELRLPIEVVPEIVSLLARNDMEIVRDAVLGDFLCWAEECEEAVKSIPEVHAAVLQAQTLFERSSKLRE